MEEENEHFILPREMYLEMEKRYSEPETVNYHKKDSDAIEIAVRALARIEAIHSCNREYVTFISREMNNVAIEALMKISEIYKK